MTPRFERTAWMALVAVAVAAGILARFLFLDSYPAGIYGDEAYNGYDAMRALSEGDLKIFYAENNGREGGLIALIALSVALLDNTILALRLPGALVGTLTVLLVPLALYNLFLLLAPRAGPGEAADAEDRRTAAAVALGCLVLVALSYWHVTLSRIAFRAILDPLSGVLAFLGISLALRYPQRWWIAVLAGLVCGLGVYGYSTYRFLVFPIALVFGIMLARDRWLYLRPILIMSAAALVTAGPWLAFALRFPELAFERAREVSVLTAEAPGRQLLWSTFQTAQMFFGVGDLFARTNLPGEPQLNPIVFVFFVVGMLLLLNGMRSAPGGTRPSARAFSFVLVLWFLIGLAPAVLTVMGWPGAVRSISSIVPAMAIAAVGAAAVGRVLAETERGRAVSIGISTIMVLALVAHLFSAYFVRLRLHPYYEGDLGFAVERTAAALELAGLSDEMPAVVLVENERHPRYVWNESQFLYLAWDRFADGRARLATLEEIEADMPDAPATLFVPAPLEEVLLERVPEGVRVVVY